MLYCYWAHTALETSLYICASFSSSWLLSFSFCSLHQRGWCLNCRAWTSIWRARILYILYALAGLNRSQSQLTVHRGAFLAFALGSRGKSSSAPGGTRVETKWIKYGEIEWKWRTIWWKLFLGETIYNLIHVSHNKHNNLSSSPKVAAFGLAMA